MRPAPPFLRFAIPALLVGLGASWTSAQVDLPPLETTGGSRPALERPRSWEPANRTPTSVNSRSSSRGTSRIPDPTIFDGSGYPEEERPEQAMIAQFEVPGGEPQPATQNQQGPGQQQGAGGQGPGGDGGQGGGGGPQMAGGIPGMPPMGGGGQGGEGGQQSLEQIAESQMGDQGAGQGQEGQEGQGQGGQSGQGQQGQQGQAGAQGAADAPQVAANQQGRALERPSEVQIGDDGARLAEADVPLADASKQLENEAGEDRMSVEAASGNQSGNRGSGTERGVDIPSNL